MFDPEYSDVTLDEMNSERLRDAIAGGFTVVEADDLTLQLDLDQPNQLRTIFWPRYDMLKKYCPDILCEQSEGVEPRVIPSKTAGHYHVYIRLKKPLPLHLRIGLQMMLGSDPMRESLNMVRCLNGVKPCVVLFEKSEVR